MMVEGEGFADLDRRRPSRKIITLLGITFGCLLIPKDLCGGAVQKGLADLEVPAAVRLCRRDKTIRVPSGE